MNATVKDEEPQIIYKYVNFNGMKCVTSSRELAYARSQDGTEVEQISLKLYLQQNIEK